MMFKPKHTLLILLCLLLPAISFAQTAEGGYYTGYIVSEQGDTLQGNLKKENNYINPETVVFKYNGEETEYGPSAIKAFYIKDLNLLFESYLVSKNKYNNTYEPIRGEIDLLGPQKDPKMDFLLTIAKTKDIGIYQYTQAGEESFYVRKEDKVEELLFVKQLILVKNVGLRLSEKRRYRIQLLGALIDCESVASKINLSNYNPQSLTAVLKAYAKCVGKPLVYNSLAKKKSTLDVKLGLNASYGTVLSTNATSNNLLFEGANRIRSSDHDGGRWFEVGLTSFITTKRDSRVSFRVELKLKNQTIERSWERALPIANILSRNSFRFESTFFSLGALVDLSLYQSDKVKVFLEAGLFFGEALSGEFESVEGVLQTDGSTLSTSEIQDIAIRETDNLWVAGVGARFNKLGVSIRSSFSISNQAGETTTIDISSVAGLSLNLFYLFN